jgi:hypothetical protein
LKLLGGLADLPPPASVWDNTAVRLPPSLAKLNFVDALGSVATEGKPSIPLRLLFATIPIALLVAD